MSLLFSPFLLCQYSFLLLFALHFFTFSLGNGWYGKLGGNISFKLNVKMNFKENKNKKEIISNLNWKMKNGPIIYSDIYNGETFDERRETPGLFFIFLCLFFFVLSFFLCWFDAWSWFSLFCRLSFFFWLLHFLRFFLSLFSYLFVCFIIWSKKRNSGFSIFFLEWFVVKFIWTPLGWTEPNFDDSRWDNVQQITNIPSGDFFFLIPVGFFLLLCPVIPFSLFSFFHFSGFPKKKNWNVFHTVFEKGLFDSLMLSRFPLFCFFFVFFLIFF